MSGHELERIVQMVPTSPAVEGWRGLKANGPKESVTRSGVSAHERQKAFDSDRVRVPIAVPAPAPAAGSPDPFRSPRAASSPSSAVRSRVGATPQRWVAGYPSHPGISSAGRRGDPGRPRLRAGSMKGLVVERASTARSNR